MADRTDYQWIGPTMPPPEIEPPLKVAIVPTPDFTLMSFSCLVEYLRLAADESDFSRQVYCSWSLLAADDRPLVSSSGLAMLPTADMGNLEQYDVVVFHGGTMHSTKPVPQYVYDGIQQAVDKNLPIVGLCTGQFLLAEMGLLDGRQCAVHFSLEPLLRKHFPKVTPISDRPVVEDGRFMTCPGGLASINLGTQLVSKRCGASRAEKVLHYLMADKKSIFEGTAAQDQAFIGEHCLDRRVVNAIGIMRQRMYERCDISDIAQQVGTTKRELTRLFNRYLRVPPAEYWRGIRLSAAHWMVVNTDRSITQIAYECGFTDSSHLIRWFQKRYKLTPTALRRASISASVH
ncbi:AraC family transcriptional regulator [Leisingera sp. ANG-M1]|uniref:GlxA family transcriptional regulator n=1 Tax=Leisingera sp. ANG-M1 TaxID=1577895 RepID=UPI00057EC43A|nr:helix-turn-helix domain-containing protein [Leisingera sp. ANG-M1]KIC11615.1 AraC family transcriptional regulator [Leisingera sp. ANG-M1]